MVLEGSIRGISTLSPFQGLKLHVEVPSGLHDRLTAKEAYTKISCGVVCGRIDSNYN